MSKCYFELRKQAARGTDSLIADAMRHLHTRQHLGKAVVLCEQPLVVLSTARKQWLRLAHSIQNQRARTLNAEKILKYTHAITVMQHMRFTTKPVLDDPEADMYFMLPNQAKHMPVQCLTVYTMTPDISNSVAGIITQQLPPEALVVDYNQNPVWEKLGIQPKNILETHVTQQWRQASQFLATRHINILSLADTQTQNVEAMDDALDMLLSQDRRFLEIATEFQRALALARPLRLSQETRRRYDTLILLAHRVQALTPTAFTQRFLESYNENDTFFLYDVAKRRFIPTGESLAEAINRHLKAGRFNLAQALRP